MAIIQRVSRLFTERRIPYALSRRISRNPQRSWFWRLARCFYSEPASFFRVAGCFPLPVQTVSHEAFAVRPFAEVSPVSSDDLPPCPHATNPWPEWTTQLPEALRDCGIPSCHTVTIPSGYAEANGNVFSAAGRLVLGASLAVRKDVNSYYTPARLYPPVYRGQRIAAVVSSQQENYYHWMMEILPRLHMLRAQGVEVDAIYIQQAKRFQRETLDLLGLDRAHTINAAQHDLVQARELVVPFHEIKAGQCHPAWVTQFLRDQFLPQIEPKHCPTPAPRLYVARAQGSWRSVVNEAEVLSLLEPHGFRVVTLEGLSVLEQAALFAQAEVVIAPHGAALANLVFAPPGTRVVEFQPRKLQDTYFRLCRSGALPYYFIVSSTGPAQPVNNQQYLTIALDDLRQGLAWAGLE
jgi:capsular polysaccharide biosynthesis protein